MSFTPNRATIDVQNPELGGTLVYNMNFDEGWKSDAGKVEGYKDAVAVRVPAGTRRVRFWYRPPGLARGLGAACAAIVLLGVLWRRERALKG